MAIQLKQASSYELLPKFGVSPIIIAQAKKAGVDVAQDGPGNFKVKLGQQVFGVIPVKGQAITLAKQGQLGPASKQALQFQFEAALKKAIETAAISNPGVLGSASEEADNGPDDTMLIAQQPKQTWKSSDALDNVKAGKAPMSHVPEKAEFVASPKIEDVTLAMMMAPCALHQAKQLYQPVTATSKDSVYHVVALFDGLNLAARVAGGKLSLRAEGSKIVSYSSALSDLGMAIKNGHDYASVHFSIDDQGLLLKTFGAVVGRLGVTNLKQAGDILTIKGVGK